MLKIHATYLGLILLILCGGFFGYNVISKKNQKDLNEKIRLEERVKQLEIDGDAQKQRTDSLKAKAQILEGVIAYMDKNPKIIIEKYDKEKDRIFSLDASDKVKFLSDRLSKAGRNR